MEFNQTNRNAVLGGDLLWAGQVLANHGRNVESLQLQSTRIGVDTDSTGQQSQSLSSTHSLARPFIHLKFTCLLGKRGRSLLICGSLNGAAKTGTCLNVRGLCRKLRCVTMAYLQTRCAGQISLSSIGADHIGSH